MLSWVCPCGTLPRERSCSEMKGKGGFHCALTAVEFLIRLFAAFRVLLGDIIPVISSYTSLCIH